VSLPPLTLLILAGGTSSRMGRDKPALPFPSAGDPPLVARVHRALFPLAWECLIAAPVDFGLSCRLVADHSDFPGPVGGLVAGLECARTDLVLVVSADLPFPVPELALQLSLLAAANPAEDLVIPSRSGQLEPLFAVYRRRAAAHIIGAPELRAATARGPSLRQAVALLPRREVPEATWRQWDPNADSFKSCNTPGELAIAAQTARTDDRGGLT
jgi:molybdopterin-guanine dinucleotide biosynthesis protein A